MRILDGVLLVAIVVGAVVLSRMRSELSVLDKDLTRISAVVGDMAVQDNTKVHVQALRGEHRWQWAWRVYLPSKCSGTITHLSGGGSGSHGFTLDNQMIITRCSLTQTKSGGVGIYFRFAGGSSFSSFGNTEFFKFLDKNFERMKIEQFGTDATELLSPGSQPVTFLQVSMPDDLAAEARQQFGDDPNVKQLIPNLLTVNLDLN